MNGNEFVFDITTYPDVAENQLDVENPFGSDDGKREEPVAPATDIPQKNTTLRDPRCTKDEEGGRNEVDSRQSQRRNEVAQAVNSAVDALAGRIGRAVGTITNREMAAGFSIQFSTLNRDAQMPLGEKMRRFQELAERIELAAQSARINPKPR